MEENGLQNMEEERGERNKIQRFIFIITFFFVIIKIIFIFMSESSDGLHGITRPKKCRSHQNCKITASDKFYLYYNYNIITIMPSSVFSLLNHSLV